MKHTSLALPRIAPSLAYALPLVAVILLAPALAQAHIGAGIPADFTAGLQHPIGGADHVLAMGTVGLWAALRGGRAVWAMPVVFLTAMLMGGVLGMTGVPLPGIEPAILASIFVLGAAVAVALRPHLAAALTLIALFGMAHGYAHGVEAVGGAGFAAGFMAATMALHMAGLAVGFGVLRSKQLWVARMLGAGAAVAGLALAFG